MSRLLVACGVGLLLGLPVSTGVAVEGQSSSAPITVEWETPQPPAIGQETEVSLRIRWASTSLEGRAALAGAPLELRVNLPPGFVYVRESWQAVTDPKSAKDPSGPWTSYQWSGQVASSATDGQELTIVPLTLRAVEPGENWVLTARVELRHGGQTWVQYATLFATTTAAGGEFHRAPNTPPAPGGPTPRA